MPFGQVLGELRSDHVLVDIRRDEIGGGDLRGFVADLSDELVLLDIVNDGVRGDGHAIILRDDITFLRWDTVAMRAWQRSVDAPAYPESPGLTIDLSDWRSVIASLESQDRLLTFHRERMDGSVCYIARELDLSFDLVVGLQVSTEGEEDGRFALRVGYLTRLDFDGSYERGLGRMMGIERGQQSVVPGPPEA